MIPKHDRNFINISTTNAAYNRLLMLLSDKALIQLINNLKNLLKSHDGKDLPERIAYTKKAIYGFLRSKEIPESWYDPILNMVKADNRIDLPLEDGISLRIGSQIITANAPVGLPSNFSPEETKKISIEISGDVSINRIVEFVKRYSYLIDTYNKQLALPEVLDSNKPIADVALIIYEMKTNRGMSFKQIADSPELEELQIIDENSIKTIYYRYLDILNPQK